MADSATITANIADGASITGSTVEGAVISSSVNESTSVSANVVTGARGETGTAATIAVGTVTTGAAGSSAAVTNTGSTSAAVLDFAIPQGIQGIQGIQGEPGLVTSVNGISQAAITLTQDNVADGTTYKQYSATEKTKLAGIATGANVGVVPNVAITGATKTKVTYDAKGLVTAGADATTADIADSTNKRYVTDAQLTVIGNTSGTNTGNQTSIVGITGTTAQFNTANTDGDFATLAGTETLTNKTLTTPLIDTISEKTAANGVTIDSLNIKDGKLNTNNSVVTANITDGAVIAAKIEAQQAWQAPTLTNSWVNYGEGLTNAGYMKDSLGFVHFRGLVKNGTVGSAIYTLPTGYRPGNVAAFAVVSNSAFGFLQVTAAGAVVLMAGSNAFVYLDGVTFRAEG